MATLQPRDAKGRFTRRPKAPPLDPETLRLACQGLSPVYAPWDYRQWRLEILSKSRYTTEKE